MTRASQHASDEELKRKYGYSPAVITAMRETVSRELSQKAASIDIDMEGPEF